MSKAIGPERMITELTEQTRRQVGEMIADARAAGRNGELSASSALIQQAANYVKQQQADARRLKRQWTADAQQARAEINARGRGVATLVGRGTVGNAVRGGLQRGRESRRAQLAREQAQVLSAFDVFRLSMERLLGDLAVEESLIRELRSKNGS